MEGGVLAGAGERCVERDYVALAGQSVDVAPLVASFGALPGRVAQQHFHVEPSCPALHDGAYVTHAHYADSVGAKRAVDGLHQCAEHILGHCCGVAARRVDHRYAAPMAIVGIDVVGAYGGRGHYLALRAYQQAFVAACACAYYHAVGCFHGLGGDVGGCEVAHGGVRVEQSAHERHVFLDNDVYIAIWHKNKAT